MFPKRMFAPGFLTVLNLFLGYYSIILAAKGNFVGASWLILIAAIFDAFDGKVARATKSSSKFGVEFDSLADAISFGMAPSFLVYQLHFESMGQAGLIISFFPLIFGSIRLARFNVEVTGFVKMNFKGLPIPAAAATIVSFIIFNFHIWGELQSKSLMLPLVLIISVLMVSTLEFDAMPKFNFRSGRENSIHLAALLAGVVIMVFFPQETIFPLLALYILSAGIRGLLKLGKEDTNKPRRRRLFRERKQRQQPMRGTKSGPHSS